MSDPVTVLAERLADEAAMHPPTQENDFVIVDWEQVAREALAFAREQLPTLEKVADLVGEPFAEPDDGMREFDLHVAAAILRDLHARLGGT